MKLLKYYCIIAGLAPLVLTLLKGIGIIGLSWIGALLVGFAISFVMFALLVAVAIYVIKSIPQEEWER